MNDRKIIIFMVTTLLCGECLEENSVRSKTKKFCKIVTQNLKVCDNAVIRGNLIVEGSITSSSIPAPVVLPLIVYSYASTRLTASMPNTTDVIFTSLTPSLNVSYALSAGGGTATILPAGTYQYLFSVNARVASGTDAASFALVIDDTKIANSQYTSENETVVAFGNINLLRTVKGFGLFSITTSSPIALRNFSGDIVVLASPGTPTNPADQVTASLTFIRIGD